MKRSYGDSFSDDHPEFSPSPRGITIGEIVEEVSSTSVESRHPILVKPTTISISLPRTNEYYNIPHYRGLQARIQEKQMISTHEEDTVLVPSNLFTFTEPEAPPAGTLLLPEPEEFNTQLMQHYPPSSRTIGGEIRQEFADKIVKYLRDPMRDVDSTFRMFVRKKQFRIIQVPSAEGSEMREILVCARKDGDAYYYKRVAIVEKFYDILSAYHIQDGLHCGIKKTQSALCEYYHKIPRSVIELYMRLCPVCSKRLQSYKNFTEGLKEEGLYNKHRQSALRALEQREQALLTGEEPSVVGHNACDFTLPEVTLTAMAVDSLYPVDVLQDITRSSFEIPDLCEEAVVIPTSISAAVWTVAGSQPAVTVLGYDQKSDGASYFASYPVISGEIDLVGFLRQVTALESMLKMPMVLALSEEEIQTMTFIDYQSEDLLVVPCFISSFTFGVSRALREYIPFLHERIQQFVLSSALDTATAFECALTPQFCRLSAYLSVMQELNELQSTEFLMAHYFLQLVTSYTQELMQVSGKDCLPLAAIITLIKDLEHILEGSAHIDQPVFVLLKDSLLGSLHEIYTKNPSLCALVSLSALLHPKFKSSGERFLNKRHAEELIDTLIDRNEVSLCESRQVQLDGQKMSLVVRRPREEIRARVQKELWPAAEGIREQVCAWQAYWDHRNSTQPQLVRFVRLLLSLPATAAPPAKLLSARFMRRLSALAPGTMHAQLKQHFFSKSRSACT